jgi:hypothetical protein
MGQVLHGRATTTEAVRRAIQSSQAGLRTLAKQYGINPKTVAKWKKRDHVQDAVMGPKETHSTVLSAEEEAVIVAFRKHTLLPLVSASVLVINQKTYNFNSKRLLKSVARWNKV